MRCFAIVAACLLVGCAEKMGGRAAGGALETLTERTMDDGGADHRPSQVLAARLVEGAVTELSSPEELARLRVVVAAAAAQAVESALGEAIRGGTLGDGSGVETVAAQAAESFRATLIEGLRGDLGRQGQGEGPLAQALAGTIREASSSAARGALSGLWPECAAGAEQKCIDRRITELSHQAGVGFMGGVKDSIRWVVMVVAFLAGLLVAAILAWLWHLTHRQRALTRVAGGPPHMVPRDQPT